ncbi:Fic family protein [Pedobacter rhizosphaerae]|uniref:Fic/DOC family protein n=1 Tax=Pedobacter rhizosphaerae TaxID=390241 RepID=A0A1H9MU05_9SPHI|nr:Fic family protein [Pedobacter rhizosphaerae]SER26987.1 Fic/DOC family protein [Pedobacter rhizosphaerae]
MSVDLKIIPNQLLDSYLQQLPYHLNVMFEQLRDAELSTVNFSFYTSVSSVFSSKIEGERIELDSFIKHKRDGIPFRADYTQKIDDLYDAYIFAQHNRLSKENIAEAHRLLSRHILNKSAQGNFRTQNMYVSTPDGKIEYVAALPFDIPVEMQKFYLDLETLINANLSIEETFFYAAMIHLVFVKIHPWNDGNGRSVRLIEKWFLAEKLGQRAWYLPSERYYYDQHELYYTNIRKLGLEYFELDYSNSMPFLLMLPASF